MTWVRDEHPILIQELRDDAGFACGNELFLLRDDLIPAALGGNKVRIAAEYLRDAREQGANALIMYGDRRSNLCRVLALACHAEGMPSLMVTSSAPSGRPSFNERIIAGMGVEMLSCRPDAIADAIDRAFETLSARGLRPYYIFGNRLGAGNEGTAANAYARVYRQILAWEQENGTHFDLIVLPYGTGATQGGLVAGSLVAGDGRDIVGISISSRTPERAMDVLASTVTGWFVKQGAPCPPGYRDALHLECGYNGGGYGIADARVAGAISAMMREAAIPMDPVYSGKAFLGMRDYLSDRGISGKRILFLHTGGLPIFFDHLAAATEEPAC